MRALDQTNGVDACPLCRDAYVEAGLRGFYRPSHSTDVGGLADRRYSLRLFQELGDICPAFTFWIHSEVFCGLLLSEAPKAIIARYGARCVKGELLGCMALTESSGGSAMDQLSTTATKHSDGYTLRGMKAWVSLGGVADLALVSARDVETASVGLYLVDLKAEGVSVRPIKNRYAMRELDIAAVTFEDVFVPRDHRINERATLTLLKALSLERFICSVVATAALGRTLNGYERSPKGATYWHSTAHQLSVLALQGSKAQQRDQGFETHVSR